MSRFITAALILMLAGCDSMPAPPPPPAMISTPVICAPPAGMTERAPEPDRPAGDYTQRSVAGYVTSLHEWGSAGWDRVEAIDDYSHACVQRNQQSRPQGNHDGTD